MANLDNLTQLWSAKCWVASNDDLTYMFGRIYPVSPIMSINDMLTNRIVLDDAPTQVTDAFRLPAFVREGQTMANMAIRIKFRGSLPDRIALNSAVYRVRSHTIPVLRCLLTSTDPVSGNPSTLDLCLGNGPLLLTTITTSPYIGGDRLPVVISFPSVPTTPFHHAHLIGPLIRETGALFKKR